MENFLGKKTLSQIVFGMTDRADIQHKRQSDSLSRLPNHPDGVDIPFHFGSRDRHQPSHCSEGLFIHLEVHLLKTILKRFL